MATNILTTIAEYMKYAPGVDAGLQVSNLQPSFFTARKAIAIIITDTIYDKIVALESTDEKKQLLTGALANLTLSNYKVFDAVNTRINQGKEIYKYELTAMRREYINNHFTYIDSLIALLEKGEGDSDWKATPLYKLKETLPIKSLAQFESYYPIDSSYFFFFKTINLQQDVVRRLINPIVKIEAIVGNKEQLMKVEQATVLYTVARAIELFDVYELPMNIRNTSGQGDVATHKLYDTEWQKDTAMALRKEAKELVLSVANQLNSRNSVSDTALNNESDKSFLMS